EPVDVAHAQTLARLVVGSAASGRIEELARGWGVYYPHRDFTFLFETDESREERDASYETLRPVDRVDNPLLRRLPRFASELFPTEPVIGEFSPKDLDDPPLTSAIGFSDGGAV